MNRYSAPEQLSDNELIAEVSQLAASECQATSALVRALAELDARRLYLGQGCSSMFTYCTQVLHLAEHAAYNRIEVARAARRFPIIVQLLADGHIHLTAVRLLAPHLTEANHHELLREASHRSKRDVEHIVARLQPRPDVPSTVRKLPTAASSMTATGATPEITSNSTVTEPSAVVIVSESQRPIVKPLAPERYKLQFTVGRETYDKLRRVQDLLGHRVPSGDPAEIFDRALSLLLEHLEKAKRAATERPHSTTRVASRSRHVPADVRRAVWARDGGRCKFAGAAGRCCETGRLEFHHVVPYAEGGATTLENLELRCAAHNRYEAQQWFGMFGREDPIPFSTVRGH
jgi:5-methylcytosine-specific restriction endonuclease McrA